MIAGGSLLAAGALLGCSAHERPAQRLGACPDAPGRGSRLGVVAESLRGGTPDERFLSLGPEQEAAVVALYGDGDFGPEPVCTGVLVSDEHVLTARHCVDGVLLDRARLTVRLGPSADQPMTVAGVSEIEVHPSVDLALLVLSHTLSDDAGVLAIAARTQALEEAVVGREVAVAGYGLDDDLVAGTRAYGVVRIEGLEAEHLRVIGRGRTGLCFGDSGGPLIARAQDGAVEVLGVLAQGSSACKGADRFTRLDRVGGWLESLLPKAHLCPHKE
jgi:hypothetical protein